MHHEKKYVCQYTHVGLGLYTAPNGSIYGVQYLLSYSIGGAFNC
ncbi:hypothetical protein Salpa_0501 [Sporomusa sp. KB1]|jgi:hypothetical protein|nr:hypothetical protein Salpa_0501 [Sporomusa sp. KB1]